VSSIAASSGVEGHHVAERGEREIAVADLDSLHHRFDPLWVTLLSRATPVPRARAGGARAPARPEAGERGVLPTRRAFSPGRPAAAALVLLLEAAGSAAAPRELYDLAADQSRVRVHVDRAGLLSFLGHDHELEAPLASGWIELDRAEPTASRVDLRFHAAELAVVPGTEPAEDVPKVERQMRGPEVLDVERHPEIRFWSFAIEVVESDPQAGRHRLRVQGGLELKGARHRVLAPLEVRLAGDEIVASGEAKLRLSALGVHPPSVAGVVKVADEFRVEFEVRARRRAAQAASAR